MSIDQDELPSESFLRRAMRKLIVMGYGALAPLRRHPTQIDRIFLPFLPKDRPDQGRVRLLVIVPFKDKVELTQMCFRGLLEQDRDGIDLCVALVDNNSSEAGTRAWLDELQAHPPKDFAVRHLSYQQPFNFSFLNNQAARDCADFRADVIAFINNDIEFTERKTLQTLSRLAASDPRVGALGCTLIYPDHRIQHLFVYTGSKIVGSHPLRGRPLNLKDPWFDSLRQVPAVTGAVMFLRSQDFKAVGGFDEELATSYQDVDLCMKFQQRGLVNVCAPFLVNIHHETQTRSKTPNYREAAYAYAKWGDFLRRNEAVPPIYSRLAENLVPGNAFFDRLFQFFPQVAPPSHLQAPGPAKEHS